VYLRQHPSWSARGSDEDDLIARVFERFWRAIGPERFHLFADLPALLKYLKLCCHSAVLNEVRSQRSTTVVSIDDAPEETMASDTAEAAVIDSLATRELWAVVEAELHDDAERLVAYLSFALDLKPSEIHERHTDRFPSTADVYRIKRNVIDRLRRSASLREFIA
jgi:hypothetical protein